MAEMIEFSGLEIVDAKARKNLELLKNKRYIVIGDSYGEGYNVDGLTIKSWTSFLKDYLNGNSSNYYTMSVGGAGFINESSEFTFLEILQQISNSVTEKETITDIIVCGGYNDRYYTQENLENAIKTFINYAKENYPNAVVKIGCIGWGRDYNQLVNIRSIVLPSYKNCIRYGALYLNNVEYSNHDYELFTSDGYHPGEVAQRNISNAICSAVLTGSANVTGERKRMLTATGLLTGSTSYNSANPTNFYTSINNNICSFVCEEFMNVDITAQQIKGVNHYSLFELGNETYVKGCPHFRYSTVHCNVLLHDTSGTINVRQAMFFLGCQSGTGKCMFTMRLNETGETLNNINKITIPPFSLKMDSLYC